MGLSNLHSIVFDVHSIFENSINGSFKYKLNTSYKKSVDNFLKLLQFDGIHELSLGVVYFYDYFANSYNFYTDNGKITKSVPIDFILGKNQYKRWNNRNEHYQYFYIQGIFEVFKIPDVNYLKDQAQDNGSGSQIHEDIERSRYYNVDRGFLNCIDSTSLCKPDNPYCDKCINRDMCIKYLSKVNPNLALKRNFIKL